MADVRVVAKSHLPALLEGCRAISGLVAIVALLGVVALTTLPNGLISSKAVLQVPPVSTYLPSDVKVTPVAPQPQVSAPATPTQFQRPTTEIFYLVCTPDQATIADWGEATWNYAGVSDSPNRSYRILYACDDAQLQDATNTVTEYMLGANDGTNVQLIDLRDVH